MLDNNINNFIKNIITKDLHSIIKSWSKFIKNERLLSNNTIKAYESDVTLFMNFVFQYNKDKVSLKAIDKLTVRDFRSWLSTLKNRQQNFSAKTQARHRASLRSFFKYSLKNNFIKNTNLFSFEANGVVYGSTKVDWLAGFRWIGMNETLRGVVPLASGQPPSFLYGAGNSRRAVGGEH